MKPIRTQNLIYAKIAKHKYTPEQIDIVIQMLEEGKSVDEIAKFINMSNRRVKTIRWILNNGTDTHIKILKDAKYIISSIKRQIYSEKKRTLFNPEDTYIKLHRNGKKIV
jgi:DNA invertase Pin-like site-specific DNA recombinase